MNHDEINQWIRWQRCKVILAMAAEYLFIALIPMAIIIWMIGHYAHL